MGLRIFGLACLFAIVALGCGGFGTDYDVYVVDDTPRAWVDEAVAEWHAFTGVTLRVHWPPGNYECNEDCVVVRLGTPAEVQAMCSPPAIGCTQLNWKHDSGFILLDATMSDVIGREVTIHEFGHALGLQHACPSGCPRITTARTVMNPTAGASAQHVTCDDVHQYEELRGWGDSACDDPRLDAKGELHLVP